MGDTGCFTPGMQSVVRSSGAACGLDSEPDLGADGSTQKCVTVNRVKSRGTNNTTGYQHDAGRTDMEG